MGQPAMTSRAGLIVRLILKWIVAPVATVFASSFVIFLALSAAPGDPVAQILGARATDEQRAALTAQLGLDQPVLVRYGSWVADAFHGNFGLSVVYKQDVSVILGPRIGTTVILVIYAAIIILVTGIAVGLIGGIDRRARPIASALIGLGIAIPGYVAALVLVGIFAVQLRWFPTFGAGSGFLDQLWHLTLPAIALSIAWSAYVAQISSTAVREESAREHVATAIARGLPRSLVIRRHILRNAAVPVLTASGLTVAGLVAGSVVVESAFAVDGLGSLLVRSVAGKDYSPVTAIAVIIVAVFVLVTTLIDVAQTVLDPKLRAGGSAG